MTRRIAAAALALTFIAGCAGPAKLTHQSQEKLAKGDAHRAWQLATRALDKEPGNPQARAAATAAGASIAAEWERHVRALADVDSLQAAEQVLEFSEFRASAARYATIAVDSRWPADEQRLRRTAARIHYEQGLAANDSKRPKKAWLAFDDAQRFVPGYRESQKLMDRSLAKALTRVALIPFSSPSEPLLGVQITEQWRGDLVQGLAAPAVRFTRVMDGDAIEGAMTVNELGRLSREEAVRLGRKTGAQRVVWATIGAIHSDTHLQSFQDVVARKVTDKDQSGHETSKWVDVPIEVIARVRDVTVGLDYEVVSTKDGASLARQRVERSISARVVWTSYQPEGDPASYSLVSETSRATNPAHAREVETRWKSVCGDETSLRDVLVARRASRAEERYSRSALPRFMAGAAFVFLSDLPPADDLAFAALSKGSSMLRDDLVRLDSVDDLDAGVESSESTR